MEVQKECTFMNFFKKIILWNEKTNEKAVRKLCQEIKQKTKLIKHTTTIKRMW